MSVAIPKGFGTVSTRFKTEGVNPNKDELSSGIRQGFAIVSLRGKMWHIKHQGVERTLMREDGDGARASLELVLVRASSVVAKMWYEAGYEPGANSPPDCFSTNGATPDPASPKKQCATCAACPRNAWGSKITPAGKQGKECSDYKRVAVVPANDVANEMFGGPMLLRVPAASLGEMAGYGQKMSSIGYPYYAVATRVGFTADEFPKLTFGAIRALDDDEADIVLAHRDGEVVKRMLDEASEIVTHEPEKDPAQSAFEQPPQQKAAPQQAPVQQEAAPAAAPAARKPRSKPAAAAPAPVAAPPPQEDDGDEDQGDYGDGDDAQPAAPAVNAKANPFAPPGTGAPQSFDDMLNGLV